jgi:NitT/TauT family transport system substrate-binding protein
MRVCRYIAIAVLVLVTGLPVPGTPQTPEPVRFRLDWAAIIGYHGPFYQALERGYYRDANLAVEILEGKGSGTTVQLVGNGTDTIGFADLAVAARSIGVGIPVKSVMGVIRRSPAAVVFPADRGISTPQDLKGRTLATCAGQAAGVLLPAYLRAINLSSSDVKLVVTDCGAIYRVITEGKADAATGFGPGSRTEFARLGVRDIRQFDYADVGILLPSHGLIAAVKTLESKPDVVRGFVAATTRGWLEARSNPGAAIDALVRAKPLLKGQEATLRADLEGYLRYTTTPGTERMSFGWQSPDEWKRAEGILAQYLELKPQPSTDAYFTNEFVTK